MSVVVAADDIEGLPQGPRTIGRSGLLFAVAGGAQLLATVLVLPIATRLLDTESYGIVALALVVQQAVIAAASLGIGGVAAWDIYEGTPSALDHARRLVTTTFGIACAVTAVVHVLGPWWTGAFAEVDYGGAIQLAVLMAIPVTVVMSCQSVLLALNRPRGFILLSFLAVIGGQALGVTFLAVHSTSTAYLAGLFVGALVAAVTGIAIVRPSPFRWATRERVVAAFHHGGPTVPHTLGFMVLAVGDRILVERLSGLDEAGRYQAAYLIGALALSAMQVINYAWAPAIYGAQDATRWRLLRDTTGSMYLIGALVLAVLSLGGPVALGVVAPSGYELVDLLPVVVIVAASVVPGVLYQSSVHVLFQQKRTVPLIWIMPIAAVVNIGLNLALIPPWGLTGAAVATFAGYVVTGVLARMASNRLVRVSWHRAAAVRAIGFALAIAVIGLVLPHEGVAILVLRGVLAAAAGVLAVVMLLRIDKHPENVQPARAG